VRKAVELGAIIVTERGKALVRLEAIAGGSRANPFPARRLRPGYVRLKGDSVGAPTARRSWPTIATGPRLPELFAAAAVNAGPRYST
jgi:hypothetical protein